MIKGIETTVLMSLQELYNARRMIIRTQYICNNIKNSNKNSETYHQRHIHRQAFGYTAHRLVTEVSETQASRELT